MDDGAELNQHGTRFLEAEAILAAQERDTGYLEQVLDAMLPGELERLELAACLLVDYAREARVVKERQKP